MILTGLALAALLTYTLWRARTWSSFPGSYVVEQATYLSMEVEHPTWDARRWRPTALTHLALWQTYINKVWKMVLTPGLKSET